MSKRLSIHEDVYDRLTQLAARYNCSVTRLLVELADLGELLSEASRLEFHLPEQTGGTMRVWLPGTGLLWPHLEPLP